MYTPEVRDELPKALEARRKLAAAGEGCREPRRTSQWSPERSTRAVASSQALPRAVAIL